MGHPVFYLAILIPFPAPNLNCQQVLLYLQNLFQVPPLLPISTITALIQATTIPTLA